MSSLPTPVSAIPNNPVVTVTAPTTPTTPTSTNPSQTALEIPDILVHKEFHICPHLNKNALQDKRVFLTTANLKDHVYVKSGKLFVESVEPKVLHCRVIDDDSKSFLDELDYFVLNKFNEHKTMFLPSTVGRGNVRSLVDFTRESGSYIDLAITDRLNIFDLDNNKVPPSTLKHRIVRALFSPVCVDIKPNNKFGVQFYGFTVAMMKDDVPEYLLEELAEAGLRFEGVSSKPRVPTVGMSRAAPIDFGSNPF